MPDDSLPTRLTLLLRMRDADDAAAWEEFTEIYCPLFYSYCLRRRISPEDTADIVQDVMRSVALAMRGFEYDPAKGTFKGWLFTSLRNRIGAHFKKKANRPVTTSETLVLETLEANPSAEEDEEWERDYHVRLMTWAIEKVKPEFADRIWRAFELTAVHGEKRDVVAAQIGMTKNAVTIAKCRVLARVREKASSVDPERWEKEIFADSEKV